MLLQQAQHGLAVHSVGSLFGQFAITRGLMGSPVDHDVLDAALKRCGSNWDAAQTHGLLSGRLASTGADGGFDWLEQVLEDTDPHDVLRTECETMLGELFESTYRQLSERQSEFEPLLPEDGDSAAVRAAALGRWCVDDVAQ